MESMDAEKTIWTAKIIDAKGEHNFSWDKKPSLTLLSPAEVGKLYKRIVPVIRNRKNVLMYIKKCHAFDVAFPWSPKQTVKSEGLKVLDEIPTLHKWGYYGFFKPSVAEVLSQIPQHLAEDVVAFETIGPETSSDLNLQHDVVDAGYHLATTILYGRGRGYKVPSECKNTKHRDPKPASEKRNPLIKDFKVVSEDPRFNETFYVVDDSGGMYIEEWAKYCSESPRVCYPVKWKQDNPGAWLQLGTVAKEPVCVTFFWHLIEGKRVLFWEPTSNIVDHSMIKDFINRNCPNSVGSSNLENFHNCIHAVMDAVGKRLTEVKYVRVP